MKLIQDLGTKNKWGRRRGLYICPDCETENEHTSRDVKSGKIKRCLKCSKARPRNIKHGDSHTKLHQVWSEMRSRCTNVKHKNYKYYGGRGISIDLAFNEYQDFKNWSELHGYEEGLSIDRIDNEGNYTPNNCRWATHSEQMLNRRRCKKYRSKEKGVVWHKQSQKWRLVLKYKLIGTFKTENEAIEYKNKEMRDER